MAADFPTIDLDGLPVEVAEEEAERVMERGGGYREVLFTTREGYPAAAYTDPEWKREE